MTLGTAASAAGKGLGKIGEKATSQSGQAALAGGAATGGVVGGAAGGAAAGATVGALGGPIGAGIGAVVGGIGGAMGAANNQSQSDKEQGMARMQEAANKAKEGAEIQTGEPMNIAWQFLKGLSEQQMFTALRNVPSRQVSSVHRFLPGPEHPDHAKLLRQGTVHPRAFGMMVAHDKQFGGEGMSGLQQSLRTYSSDKDRYDKETGKWVGDKAVHRDVRNTKLPEQTEGNRIILPAGPFMARPMPNTKITEGMDVHNVPGENKNQGGMTPEESSIYAAQERVPLKDRMQFDDKGPGLPKDRVLDDPFSQEAINAAMEFLSRQRQAGEMSENQQRMLQGRDMDRMYDDAFDSCKIGRVTPTGTPDMWFGPNGQLLNTQQTREAGYEFPNE